MSRALQIYYSALFTSPPEEHPRLSPLRFRCGAMRDRMTISALPRSVDQEFLKLPDAVRHRIEAALDDMGLKLVSYPHYRMSGSDNYRLRIGDYRIIYTIDRTRNEIHLLAVGHRREIYR